MKRKELEERLIDICNKLLKLQKAINDDINSRK